MSQAASQWAAFARDVAKNRKVWTLEDANGYPAPEVSPGQRAMPFWSTQSRAEKIVKNVAAYRGFTALEISWDAMVKKWLPELEEDKLLIGVNWSGPRATGYDVRPDEVITRVNYEIELLERNKNV